MLFDYFLAFTTLYVSVLFLLIYLERADEFVDPEPTRFPSVSIIVPAYNEEEHIRKSVSSLLKLDYGGKLDVIVVSDGSTDRTAARARSIRSKRVRVFEKPNGGKASAINYGLKKARGELVVVLDADSIVDPKALYYMVGYFDDASVAAVVPMMKVWRSETPAQKLQKAEYLLNSFMKKLYEQLDAITVTPGPFSVYRKSVLKKLGGFDESTVTEDQEIALRLQANDYRIASSVNAVVYTDVPKSLYALFKQRKRWYSGYLDNIWKYKWLVRPDYGDLGLFVIPATVGVLFFGLLAFAYGAYTTFFVGPEPFRLDLFYAGFGVQEVLLLGVLCTAFLLMFLAAERLREKNYLALFASSLVLAPIMTVFWALIILINAFNSITGVKQVWRGED